MAAIGTLIRGDYEVIRATITEPNPASPGQRRNRDITSDTFRFTAKRNPNDTATFLTKTDGSGITKTDAAGGELEIEILGSDTANITQATTLYCDLEGTMTGDRRYTELFELKVVPDIST